MYQFNLDRFSIMIELWLKMNNMSNQDLAELAGIGVSTLYALKSGQYAPSMAQFTAILNVVEMPPETFFKVTKSK
jgi:transcriptional regulator with XRE-family HTH domain